VDDSSAIREVLRAYLESLRVHVVEAASAIEAIIISYSHSQNIDLLFTDIDMSGGSGWNAAREIARLRPGIHILFMSGGITRAEWENSTNKPSRSYFIQKPFRLEELNSTLNLIFSSMGDHRDVNTKK